MAVRFMRDGRSRKMGLGPIHTVSLAMAREKALDCRRKLLDGIDPISERNEAKQARRVASTKGISFREAAEKYIAAHRAGWKNAKHAAQWSSTLNTYAYPAFGALPVAAVDVGLVLKVLEPIWQEKTETATRVQTGSDHVQIGSERVQTGTRRVQTGTERVLAGVDRVQVGTERVQTGTQRVLLGEERVRTGSETVTTGYRQIQVGERQRVVGLERVKTGTVSRVVASEARSADVEDEKGARAALFNLLGMAGDSDSLFDYVETLFGSISRDPGTDEAPAAKSLNGERSAIWETRQNVRSDRVARSATSSYLSTDPVVNSKPISSHSDRR